MDNNGVAEGGDAFEPPSDVDRTQQVIYAVSHDLRAPARHIDAFLGLLADHLGDSLDEVANGYMARVVAATDVLGAKLDALSTYSRVVTQGGPLRPCSVEAALVEAISALQSEIDDSGARLTVGELSTVVGDPGQLAAVFLELLGNTLKFCPAGVSIKIECEASDELVLIRVEDDGPGFTDQRPERALELFRRFHGASVPGTGAGLAIVERIVARHGGHVGISTGTDQGTIVEFGLRAAALPS